jgi:hypothetical protein
MAIEVQGDMKGQVVPDTIAEEAEDSAEMRKGAAISHWGMSMKTQ